MLRRLGRRWPALLLTADSSPNSVLRALRAGASGYVLQRALEQELSLALHSVLEGYRYVSPRVCEPLLELTVGGQEDASFVLTPRQREVLRLLAQGNCVKEIAYRLDLSIKTVNAHKLRLKERLGINDLAGLVFYALRQGLIDLPAAMSGAAAPPSLEYAQ
ncbi:LuxR C-terminal-related transcriptional regulator [Pseudomonas knackmussii]|uniref:LuxR C-terminal-related transcriptional regulator n=1 Tax=Pseudomonas knackmussii TaxID=65741 RepID=UPI003F49F169